MLENPYKHGSIPWLVLLLVLVTAVYLPSLGGGFVGLDDRIISENPQIRQLSAGSIFRTFVPSGGIGSSYQPLRSLTFSIVYAVQGANPAGFLILNLLLYLANIILFHKLALLLLGERRSRNLTAALVAAALFAFHPVHVEIVSWHQGSKVTLMGLFYLWSLICYYRFRSGGGELFYWFCLFLFVAALMSQPAAVSLPLVIVLWEVLGTPGLNREQAVSPVGAVALRLAPFFLPAAALAFHLLFVSSVRLGAGAAGDAPLVSRLAFLPVVLGKSMLKFLLPVNLCARYPLDVPVDINPFRSLGWLAFCAAVGWVVLRMTSNRATGWFLLLIFVVTALPSSGMVETSTLMADRYQYLPGMALCLVAGFGLKNLLESDTAGKESVSLTAALLLVVLTGLAVVSLARQSDWHNRLSLWSRVVQVYPGHSLGHFNLADAYAASGEKHKAIEHYGRALEINPGYGDAYANLSTLVLGQGRVELARRLIGNALKLRPDRAEVWIKHGNIMAASSEDSLAEVSYRRAIEIDDDWAWAGHFNMGMLYLGRGDTLHARTQLQLALDKALSGRRPQETEPAIRNVLKNLQATGREHQR